MESLVRGDHGPTILERDGQMECVERSKPVGSFLQPCSCLPIVAVIEDRALEHVQPQIVCKRFFCKYRMLLRSSLPFAPTARFVDASSTSVSRLITVR